MCAPTRTKARWEAHAECGWCCCCCSRLPWTFFCMRSGATRGTRLEADRRSDAPSNAMQDVASTSGARSRCTAAGAAQLYRDVERSGTARRGDIVIRQVGEYWFTTHVFSRSASPPAAPAGSDEGLAGTRGPWRQEADTRAVGLWASAPEGHRGEEGRTGERRKRAWVGQGVEGMRHSETSKLPVGEPMPEPFLSREPFGPL